MTNTNFQPLGDRVLVQEYKTKEAKKSAGGIIIPETVTSEDVKMGKVIAVGNGLFTQTGNVIPMTVRVGDEVVLPPYGNGQTIHLGKEEYVLYRESELLGIASSTASIQTESKDLLLG